MINLQVKLYTCKHCGDMIGYHMQYKHTKKKHGIEPRYRKDDYFGFD